MSAAGISMTSLIPGYGAVVIGAGGAIGGALERALAADPRAGRVLGFSRSRTPPIDFAEEGTVAAAAEAARAALSPRGVALLLIATGALTIDGVGPEKALADLDPTTLARQFAVNAIGPALVLKHFTPILAQNERVLVGVLSARVGSIGDNRLGGWHGYRAAKAALNQILRGAAVELRRRRPQATAVALHPGTVASALTAPFRPEGAGARGVVTPEIGAERLLRTLDARAPEESGGFFAYDGAPIPW